MGKRDSIGSRRESGLPSCPGIDGGVGWGQSLLVAFEARHHKLLREVMRSDEK